MNGTISNEKKGKGEGKLVARCRCSTHALDEKEEVQTVTIEVQQYFLGGSTSEVRYAVDMGH